MFKIYFSCGMIVKVRKCTRFFHWEAYTHTYLATARKRRDQQTCTFNKCLRHEDVSSLGGFWESSGDACGCVTVNIDT